MIKRVLEKKEAYIQFTEEEMEELKIQPNQKFTVEIEDDSIKLVPFASIDIDLSEFPRDLLEMIIQISADRDVSVNEVISDILEEYIENNKTYIEE